MKEERKRGGKVAEQVEKESKRWRKQAWVKKKIKSNWPCSITSPPSLIIAKSPKQSKQTKSGLMYRPVTTAWREPNHCQMSFWKTPRVNMPLCMADSNWGPPPLSSLLSFVLFHFLCVYVQGTERRHLVDVWKLVSFCYYWFFVIATTDVGSKESEDPNTSAGLQHLQVTV